MKFDLDTLTRTELEKLRGEVDKALSSVAERERHAALDAAERAAKAHGFSLKELTGMATVKSKNRAKNPPKYRHPENPAATWTGRGRKPQWIRDAEAAGIDIATFAI